MLRMIEEAREVELKSKRSSPLRWVPGGKNPKGTQRLLRPYFSKNPHMIVKGQLDREEAHLADHPALCQLQKHVVRGGALTGYLRSVVEVLLQVVQCVIRRLEPDRSFSGDS